MLSEDVINQSEEIFETVMDFATETSSGLSFLLVIVACFAIVFFVWKIDKIEKEPISLLTTLIVLGVAASVGSRYLSYLLRYIPFLKILQSNGDYKELPALQVSLLARCFFIAIIQESLKFALLFISTWKNKKFNETFDGIIYSIYVSIGFAVCNVFLNYNAHSVLLVVLNLILNVFVAVIIAFVFGCFYTRAKLASLGKDKGNPIFWIVMGFIIIVCLYTADFYVAVFGQIYKSQTMQMVWIVLLYTFMIYSGGAIIKKSKESYVMNDKQDTYI